MKQKRIIRFGDFVFKHRDIIPVPFVVVVILILIFTKPTFPDTPAKLLLFFTGGLVIIAGEILRIWAVGNSGSTTRSRNLIADRLVTEGPYSIVRNPLYNGNFLITLGFSVIANAVIMIPIVIIYFYIEYYPIVLREEHFLLEKFGDEYKKYLSDVPRFFPRKIKIKKSRYDRSALKGEMWTILGILIVFILMTGINFLRR